MALRQLTDKNLSGELTGINLGGVTVDHGVAVKGDLIPKLESPVSDGRTYGQKDGAWAAVVEAGAVVWKNIWSAGQYNQGDMVRDGNWTMIANKLTSERPAPQSVGDPFYYFDGVLSENQTQAKQIIVGTRYTSVNSFYLKGYRIEAVAGNRYEVFLIMDPLGAAEVDFIVSFVADETGWLDFNIPAVLVAAGVTFDLIARIQKPDAAPTIWTGHWIYDTPKNSVIPPAGYVSHAENAMDELWIATVDSDVGDRYATLAALTIGDIIKAANMGWTIQSIDDHTTYFIFGVSPASLGSPTGNQLFTFETVPVTAISHGRLANHWSSDVNVVGLIGIDLAYEDITPNENAYGVDILVQQAILPVDWDVVAHSASTAGTSSPNPLLTYDYVKESAIVIADDNYETIAELITPTRDKGVYEYRMSMTYSLNSTNTSAYFRFSLDGGTTWTEFRTEPKDNTDSVPMYYSFPKPLPREVLQLMMQARKENAGDVLNIEFIDLMIARVA